MHHAVDSAARRGDTPAEGSGAFPAREDALVVADVADAPMTVAGKVPKGGFDPAHVVAHDGVHLDIANRPVDGDDRQTGL